jgi:DNA-binding transcriptional LysR family regulator
MEAVGGYLDPSGLAAFVAAVESGTVGAAADALELTQSAASKRLARLELQLGATVLDRGRFGVQTTAAGRLLYPEAKQALAALAHAANVVSTHAPQFPALRLAASRTIGGYLVPGWLAGFRTEARAAIRVQVEIDNSHGVLALLRDGHVDIGFIESLDPVDGLQEMTIMHDEILAVVAPGHTWARHGSVSAYQLVSEPYLTREPGSGTRSVAAAALARVRAPKLEPTLEAASNESLKRAVLDGGFTLLSRLAIEDEVRAGTLCAIKVKGADMRRPLRAVRRGHRVPAGDCRRFWDYLGRIT